VVYISADCGGPGIEVKNKEGQLVVADPGELGLSLPLRFRLHSWQRWYEGVFHLFQEHERFLALGDRFDEVGKQLAGQVAQELRAGYQVFYEPQGGWRHTTPGPPVPIMVDDPSRSAGPPGN
jgi:hypothetical protein